MNCRKHLRTIYLLTVMLLIAQGAITVHDGLHANLPHDQCVVAQLLQSMPSVLPGSTFTLLSGGSETHLALQVLGLFSILFHSHFTIRAPPVHFS